MGLSERFNPKVGYTNFRQNITSTNAMQHEEALDLYAQMPVATQEILETTEKQDVDYNQGLNEKSHAVTNYTTPTPEINLPKLTKLADEFFVKMANIPCWYEFNSREQHTMLVKFLLGKGVKNPEVFAQILQASILGFGVFDEYLKKSGVNAIFYNQSEPLTYISNGTKFVEKTFLPIEKVHLAVKNIKNMSFTNGKKDACSFRRGDYWINLKNLPNEKISLSIQKITNNFLKEEFQKARLSDLLADFDMN